MTALTEHPTALAMLAAAGHGSRAWVWILGWLIVLAVLVGAVIVLSRHRGSHPRYRDRDGQPR